MYHVLRKSIVTVAARGADGRPCRSDFIGDHELNLPVGATIVSSHVAVENDDVHLIVVYRDSVPLRQEWVLLFVCLPALVLGALVWAKMHFGI